MSPSPTGTPASNSYVPGIDGLRAVAVLAVILFHFFPAAVPGGFSGVDVFFVISGYVVSSSLSQARHDSFSGFALRFYARRIVRIYPALVVCLLVAGLVQTLLVPSAWLSTTGNKTALAAFFGLGNFALIRFDDGYFSPRVEFNTFTHTWSLGVEEQFYLLYPAVLFIWLKWRDRAGMPGVVTRWLLGALLVASLAYSAYETSSHPDWAYYLLPSRFWELALGALLLRLHQQQRALPASPLTANLCIAAGLVLIALGITLASPRAFPFPWALLPACGALLAMAGVAAPAGRASTAGWLLNNPLSVYVGKLSYSLYLWHWPILVFFRWTVGLEQPLYMGAAWMLTIVASVVSYHLIETPIRRSPAFKAQSDRYVLTAGIATIALCTALTAGVFKLQPAISLSVTRDVQTWYPEAWPLEPLKGAMPSPELTGKKIFVLGDSHAEAYATMLEMLRAQQGMQVHPYVRVGCAVGSLLGPVTPSCVQVIEDVFADVRSKAAPGDMAFLAALRLDRVGNQWGAFNQDEIFNARRNPEGMRQRAVAVDEADQMITRLEQMGLRVIIDAPKPLFKVPPYRCADTYTAHNPVCRPGLTMDRSFLQSYRQPVMDSLAELQRRHPKLTVWDPFPVLCPAAPCSALDASGPLFFDGDHLSGHGNRVLYPSFLATLERKAP